MPNDSEALWALINAIQPLNRLAKSDNDLQGLREVNAALRSIAIADEVIDVNVALSVGFRSRDQDTEEGNYMSLRLNDAELTLDELSTTYSKKIGSDHETIVYIAASPHSELDFSDVQNWIEKLEMIAEFPESILAVSRDHIG